MTGLLIVYIILLLLGGFINITLAVYVAYQAQLKDFGNRYLLIWFSLAALICLSFLLSTVSPSYEMAWFWSRWRLTALCFITPISLLYVLVYTERARWVNPYSLFFLLGIPTLRSLLIWTNAEHQLIFETWAYQQVYNINLEVYTLSRWWSWFNIYQYALSLIVLMLLFFKVLNSVPPYRSQSIIVLSIPLFPLTFSVASVTKILPPDMPILTPLGFALAGFVLALALLRYRLLDVMPMAYDAILNGIQDGVIVADGQRRFLAINPAAEAIIGRPVQNILGKVPEEAFNARPDLLERYGKLDKVQDELRLERDGQHYTYDLRIFPITLHTKTIGSIVVLRDISARKAAEMKREALIDELDAYSSMVAHDLKNPINVIYGFAQLLNSEMVFPSKQSQMLQQIINNAEQMNVIVHELLLLARIQQENNVVLAVVDMASVIQHATERVFDTIYEKDAQIKLPADIPSALGHSPWLIEVWVNYLSNALKYGGSPPVIEIQAEQLPKMIKYSVKDNGKGLSDEEQARLFTPFTRLETIEVQGHGLGLSIVLRIIEKLGGQVGVESQVGEGSTFYFLLPAP